MTNLDPSILIRPYRNSDFENVIANLREEGLLHAPWETRENISKKTTRDPDTILIALVNDKFAGNVFIQYDGVTAAIGRLVVRKEFRGHDLGNRLLQAAELYLKKNGVTSVAMYVDAKNEKLLAYYRGQDYSEISGTYKVPVKDL